MHIQYNTQFYQSKYQIQYRDKPYLRTDSTQLITELSTVLTEKGYYIVTKHNLIFTVSNTNQLRQELSIICIIITDITIKR